MRAKERTASGPRGPARGEYHDRTGREKALRSLWAISHLETVTTRQLAELSLHGGRDGQPYPVDRETYDRSIEVLEGAVREARPGRREKADALERIAGLTDE